MLGVGRVVLDRRVEPDAVALLVALVEGRLERPAAAAATPSAPAATAPATAGAVVAGFGVALVLVGRALFLLGLRLAQLRLDLSLDLVAKVDVGIGLLALRRQPVPVA